MHALPTGTVTFFFTDIEGSTRLLEALGPAYDDLLGRHHEIVRDAFARCSAVEVGTEGDSFFAVFTGAADAVAGAVAIQRALAAEQWPPGAPLRVRIGIHTGEARIAGDTYVGLDVHRAARIMAAAHGGQILISEHTRSLLDAELGDELALRDLGRHRLRDLSGRERLFQVVADGVPAEFPPPRTLEATPNNLPVQPSELIGRELELRTIGEHLESPRVRLLTLTGPGGIGKTRLALQAAADRSHRYEDGVYFVDLSQVGETGAVLQAVVEAVGVTPPADMPLREALAEQLRRRELLLLLDNFEQVVDAAGEVVALVQVAPRLTVLATSREPLRVRGEQVLPVAPLALPLGRDGVAEIAASPAVRLFVERAQQARPGFELTERSARDVAEICARLDGVPLAIELAAARTKLFAPAELRERLERRLELLRGGARDLPARHRTLRSTIEWSYELLDDEERRVFELLSLFPSARVDAVEAVAADVAAFAEIDVLERLASLVDKSLVRSVEGERGQRLAMLGTIREYAEEQLHARPDLHLAARRAHADHFARSAEAARRELGGREREAALDELAAELGNLHGAWRFFAEEGDVARLSALLDALWPLHDARGWYHGAVALTNDLVAALSRARSAPERVEEEVTLRLSVARGLLALGGYTKEVERHYREALAVAEAGGSLPERLPVLKSLASFHLYRGEIEKTIETGRRLLELAERHGDESLRVEADLVLGPSLTFVGENVAGMEHLERALARFDPDRDGRAPFRLGPNPGVAAGAVSALLHWLFGRPDTAAERAAAALALADRLRHPYSRAYAGFHVGLLEHWNGRLQEASERVEGVLRVAEEHDYGIWRALGLVLQGVTMTRRGDAEAGVARTEEGVELYENLSTPPIFWPQVLGLRAEARAAAGRPAEALELLDWALLLAGERTWESAALRLQKGDGLLALGDAAGAEASWLHAYEDADGVGARMTQLRTATRIARLAPTADALARLRELLETFTEGLDAPLVVEARAVLEDAAPADA